MTKKSSSKTGSQPQIEKSAADLDQGVILNKKRKVVEDYYGEDLDADGFFEEAADLHDWNIKDKIKETSKYNSQFVQFLDAKGFDYTYFQKNGFEKPIVFADKSGLGLRVPSENFKVSDVKACVGSKRVVDVVDVSTQKGLTMTMKDWCEYYQNSGKRDKLLNVISLEFSHTKLENYVEAPNVVRQLDWIDTAWPQHLREQHTESTNVLEKMKYPKVQKYVLMSVAECYTDFHIDMGGTSVWYHILKGEKIFWLIPPTEKNMKKYENWILSGDQTRVFLPDIVDECQRITLKQGSTFMLPSGWIHGVYTTKDSLVFGGNFLHSFNIPMQLRVYAIENKTKVPSQYRYPFYVEMMWFVIERYVHCLTGVTYLKDPEDETDSMTDCYKSFQPINPTLSKHELEGLRALKSFLEGLSDRKRHVPKEIVQSEKLFQALSDVLAAHASDGDKFTSTGQPFMHWPKQDRKVMKAAAAAASKKQSTESGGGGKPKSKKSKAEAVNVSFSNVNESSRIDQDQEDADGDQNDNTAELSTSELNYSTLAVRLNSSNDDAASTASPLVSPGGNHRQSQSQSPNKPSRKHVMRNLPRTKGSIKKRLRPQNVPRSNVERRRRVRCHQCEPCTRDDCGECKYCKDMKKFGGTGVSKQCCLSKQCLQPLLPTTTTCMLCEVLIDRRNQENVANMMYECEICFEIYHVQCFKKQYSHLNHIESVVNEDLVNCWQCANCVNKGYMRLDNAKSESAAGLNQSFNETNESFEIKEAEASNLSALLNVSSLESTPVKSVKKPGRPPKTEPQQSLGEHDYKPVSSSSPIKKFGDGVKVEHNGIHSSDVKENGGKRSPKKIKKSIKSVEIIASDQDDDEEVEITLESLTESEKQMILREFCENYLDLEMGGKSKKSVVKNKGVKPLRRQVKQEAELNEVTKQPVKKKKKKQTNGLLTNGYHNSGPPSSEDEEKMALMSIQRMLAAEHQSFDKDDEIVYEINDDSAFRLKDKMVIESSISSLSSSSAASDHTFKVRSSSSKKQTPKAAQIALR